MSTERRTDMGDYVLVEVGEPTVENPTKWFSRNQEWKAGTAEGNAQILRDRASTAIAGNNTFLALAAPTQAQTLAQVKLLTRECSALVRLALGLLDSTD